MARKIWRKQLEKWAVTSLKVLIVLAFLGVFGFIFMLKYTENPEFCKTCHYMVPYYESWKTSSHNQVKCIECHYPPGVKGELESKWTALSQVAKYVTGTYGTKPWAEVSDQSCLRSGCHDKRLLQGKVLFGNVIFDHTGHLREMRRGKRLRCTSCHSQIVQGSHLTVTTTTCFLCHFKDQDIETSELSNCNLCHGAPTKVVSHAGITFDHKDAVRMGVNCMKCHRNVVRGNGDVPKERCFNCHNEIERIEKYDDIFLIHETHIAEHKVECVQCHQEIQHGLIELAAAIETDCQSCHPDHHKAQRELYMGIGGRGVEAKPDPMFLTSVTCEGCHIAHKGDEVEGYTAIAPSAACMNCHGTQYGTMLSRWKSEMERRLKAILPALKRTRQEILRAQTTPERIKKALALYEDAEFNVKLIRYGKGVHNIAYSEELLRKAEEWLVEALRLVGSSYRPPKVAATSVVVTSECYRCHFGAENRVVPFRGKAFPHKTHVIGQRRPCRSCHEDNTDPKSDTHGKLTVSLRTCSNCHHRKAENCGQCHQDIQNYFTGKVALFEGIGPDVMAEGGVECVNCHEDDRGRIVRPSAGVCANCHDESYPEMLTEWQSEISALLAEVEGKISRLSARSLSAENEKVLKRIQKQFRFFKKNPSLGLHNYMNTTELLQQMSSELDGLLSSS
jgi:nitrate/TMAO reductase-like tetraheme cytochrome c subunit